MALKEISIHNISIVLVGHFNPSIINPSWLALKKLIRISEAENANLKVSHPEISDFSLSYVNIQVTKEKFIFVCDNESDFDITRDLAVSIFRILNETPINGIGLNHMLHFSLKNEDEYIKFGDWLAPHEIWKDILNKPRLIELKIVEPIDSGKPERSQVTITPSDKINPFGVRLLLNYHIELTNNSDLSANSVITEYWDKSSKKSIEIYSHVLNKFTNE